MVMKAGFIDKLIDRLDRMDAGSLQTQFLHLAREKGLLETIFHAMQEGLVVLDGRGRISYANRSAEKMFGFRLDEAAGAPMSRYLRDIEWNRVLALDGTEWARLMSREVEIGYPEHRFLAFYVVPLRAAGHDEAGAVVIFRDITRERQNAAQHVESERLRAITLLAAGVAHEIGNPLNSLTIHLQLLQRELAALRGARRDDLLELVDVSRREVSRLDGIIRQFLAAVRPVAPQLESARLDQVARETADFLKHEAADRKVLVEIESEDDLPRARVDRGQIRQAFFNIAKNAIEAMHDGGVLKITLSATDRFLCVSFRDTGSGIAADRLNTIFDPYVSTKDRGSGLGLMIVQRIVRDHGGEIEVHSEPNRGTTFTLYLPREDRLVRLLEAPAAAPDDRPAEGTDE